MSKEIDTEDGGKEIVYTQAEWDAKEAEIGTANTNLTTIKGELEEVKRVNANRSEDFTSYSKMSEEQKKTYDANTINLLKREEELVKQIEEMKGTLTAKEEKERTSTKTAAMASIHGGDEKTKTTIETNYAALAGMPETTPDEVNARVAAAARMAGISPDPRNPLYSSLNGEAPHHKDKKEYVESPEGAVAADLVRGALGVKKA